MSEKTYRIKPLVWKHDKNPVREAWEAAAVGGWYCVERWRTEGGSWGKWQWAMEDMTEGAPDTHPCRTAEEGKAAAEAHWCETITRFLQEVAR